MRTPASRASYALGITDETLGHRGREVRTDRGERED
jgi:hypothetical protein